MPRVASRRGLFLGFGIARAIKVAQGSSTVAMIPHSAMPGALLGSIAMATALLLAPVMRTA